MKYGLRVKDIMIRHPIAVFPQSTVYSALSKMLRVSVGSALVVDKHNNLIGIMTEGDLLSEIIYKHKNAKKTKVSQIMRKRLITAKEDDDIAHVMDLMKKHKIKRVPIVSGTKLVGLVTETTLAEVTPSLIDVMIEKLKVFKPGFKLRG